MWRPIGYHLGIMVGQANSGEMEDILASYERFTQELDQILEEVFRRAGKAIHCRKGCAACCYGSFYISPLEGEYLRRGFDSLPEHVMRNVRLHAQWLRDWIEAVDPLFARSFPLPESDVETLFKRVDRIDAMGMACPLLDETGCCLLYNRRPTACRYEGIPQIDVAGKVIVGEVCDLNFNGKPAATRTDLAFPVLMLEDALSDLETDYNRLRFGDSKEWKTFIPVALLEEET